MMATANISFVISGNKICHPKVVHFCTIVGYFFRIFFDVLSIRNQGLSTSLFDLTYIECEVKTNFLKDKSL